MSGDSPLPTTDSTMFLNFIKNLETLHKDHKNRWLGLRIMSWLRKHRVRIESPHGSIPSLAENEHISTYIITEIQRAPPSQLHIRDIMSNIEEGTKTQFLASFAAFESNPGLDPYSPRTGPCCVWDFCLQSESELASFITIPEEFQDGYVFKRLDDTNYKCTITVTVIGTITEPHMDQTGSETLLFELLGTKLFIIWPPTKNNLAWFRNKYGIASETILEAALDALEDPYCVLLQPGDFYLLPPGHIDCILSFTNSAIGGILVVHDKFLETAKKVMDWKNDILREQILRGATQAEKQSVKGI